LRPGFDLEPVRRSHLESLEAFLADREAHPERYLAASLPELPFASGSFDLVLSGHLLFSYAPVADGGLMTGSGLDLPWHPVYLVLGIGCGSKPGMWMNDSGFWTISRLAGLTETETLSTASVMITLEGFVGLLATIVLATLWPMV